MDTNTSRRALIGIAGITGVLVAAPAVAAPALSAIPAHADLIAKLDALDNAARSLEANPLATDAEWATYQKCQHALYRQVEALPATRENVPVKLRAVRSIYLDEPAYSDSDPATTDENLARQIVRALCGEA